MKPSSLANVFGRAYSLLFFGFLGLYVFTLAPDVLPADSGEFQVVAPLLGVAHPPGFVLYTLLGKAFIGLLPLGNPAYQLNLLSALTGAATVALVYRAVVLEARRSTEGEGRTWTTFGPRLAAFAASFILGVSTTFWSQSTTANVRSLTGVFTALALWLLAEIRSTSHESVSFNGGRPSAAGGRKDAALIIILSAGILHHASFAFIALVFGLYWLWLRRERLRSVRWWLRHATLAVLPWLLLAYLPIRGAQGAFLAPPRLATPSGFIEHVFATGFGGDLFYFASLSALPDRLLILWNILTFQFNGVILLLATIATISAVWRDRRWGLLLLAAFGLHAFVAISYRAPQTVEYLLPAYVVLAVLIGSGLGVLRSHRFPIPSLFLSVAVVLAALALFARNLPSYLYLARDRSTREYAASVLTNAPENSIVLSVWHWATPMWYLQEIEGLRPDVEVKYVYPEGESLADTWVRRIGEEVGARPVVVTAFYPREFGLTGYRFVPLGPVWRVESEPLATLPEGLGKVTVEFEDGWRMAGVAMGATRVEAGESLPVSVAWRAPDSPGTIHFFLQLLGPDGALYGQADFSHPSERIAPRELLVDRAEIVVRPDALPGDYLLVAGAYRADGSRLASPQGDHWALGTVVVETQSVPPVTTQPMRWPMGETTLLGYDFDRSLPDSIRLYLHWRLGDASQAVMLWSGGSPYAQLDLPARAEDSGPYLTTTIELPVEASGVILVPSATRTPGWLDPRLPVPGPDARYVSFGGAAILTRATVVGHSAGYTVDLEWLSARPLTQDLIAKVDFVGETGKVESDSVPAGGAIPTLKWVFGSRILDRHELRLNGVEPGEVARIEVGLYDHFTQAVVPILDPRLAMLGPTVVIDEVP